MRISLGDRAEHYGGLLLLFFNPFRHRKGGDNCSRDHKEREGDHGLVYGEASELTDFCAFAEFLNGVVDNFPNSFAVALDEGLL